MPRPPRGWSGLGEAVAGFDRLLHREDQGIRHALEDTEDEQHAVAFVGQLDGGATGIGLVDDGRAVTPQRQHVAALDTFVRAAVECHDLVLPAGQCVTVQRDDLAAHRALRRMRGVVRELALRHHGETVAHAGFLAGRGDRERGRHDLGLAGRVAAIFAQARVLGGADVVGLVAQQLARGRVEQRPRLAEDAELALVGQFTAHVRKFATRQHHTPFLRGDDARRGIEFVAHDDHGFVQERLDQVERNRRNAAVAELGRADPRLRPHRIGRNERAVCSKQ